MKLNLNLEIEIFKNNPTPAHIVEMMKSSIDDKGRIRIPLELRKKLGLTSGVDINFSVINNILLIKKVLSPEEFIEASKKINKSKNFKYP